MADAMDANDYETRRGRILQQLDADIAYFRRAAAIKRVLYRVTQLLSLACGAVVPVLVAARIGDPWVQASIAAVAAFATASVGIFKLREEWIANVFARESLIDERLAFETRAGVYHDGEPQDIALSAILARRKKILDVNLEEWRQVLVRDDPGGRATPSTVAVP